MRWYQGWIVVSDLDGTLLNHHNYSWQPAAEAIALLCQHKIPLVLSSSKTLAEMEHLAQDMGLNTPLIVENGAAVAWPDGLGYTVEAMGRPRENTLVDLHHLRHTHGYNFAGFADWQVEDVATHTGLPLASAALALQRHGTEPILWSDSDTAYQHFTAQLASCGLRAVHGGRFIHIMGNFDKADGLTAVRRHLNAQKVLALGDSLNDVGMLSKADVAVCIMSATSAPIEVQAPIVLRPPSFGPSGWAEAIADWWQATGTNTREQYHLTSHNDTKQ